MAFDGPKAQKKTRTGRKPKRNRFVWRKRVLDPDAKYPGGTREFGYKTPGRKAKASGQTLPQ